jgi:hypothetical protein
MDKRRISHHKGLLAIPRQAKVKVERGRAWEIPPFRPGTLGKAANPSLVYQPTISLLPKERQKSCSMKNQTANLSDE